MVNGEVDRQTLMIQRNNEAVTLIQRGEYTEAKRRLSDALQDFRFAMAQYEASSCPSDSSGDNDSSYESLSLDQWMETSIEALDTQSSEAASTRSFFVYPKGVQIPMNYFQDNRYCHVDFTAAIASVIFFNQGLSCHLDHIRTPPHSRNDESLQKASELYRLSLKSTRHNIQLRTSLRTSPPQPSNSNTTNAIFSIAVMNNLAVSDRMSNTSSNTNNNVAASSSSSSPSPANTAPSTANTEPNHYFETLRRFLVNWQPQNSTEERLWNCFIENVLHGCGLVRSDYCARPA